ncbi:methyltransferase domain-containing protein [Ottowia testudinis]|uniref:Methyltransferase domain-containing protein n=1 Tax=Ottowia testudinis TaxID=2816950 RepID=A0A975CGV7_9BURK|nr:methyltransferase domain-containing protein [Ottowia testudinis]QTD44861.1 methyltransferase domain-containing protein [Ottowia testudinis]
MRTTLKKIARRLLGADAIVASINALSDKIDRHAAIPAGAPSPQSAAQPAPPSCRELIAIEYLSGQGIEIGAFASPLKVPGNTKVAYLDRYQPDQMEGELNVAGLTPKDFGFDPAALIVPDIVDDGESLSKVGDLTQDFVIANHVLEHFENPIKGFKNMLRVLKHGGILYLALPEMQHSFDRIRRPTPFEHVWRDYLEGPAWSRKQAFDEFARVFVDNGMAKNLFPQKSGDERVAFESYVASELERANFSIHFHAWRMIDMVDMFVKLKDQLGIAYQIELIKANGDEVIFIFRKIPSTIV